MWMFQLSLMSRFSFKHLWELVVVGISLFSIVLFILFRVTNIASPNLPLWIAIILCGIPSVLHIIFKLSKGDLGSDLLAAIAIITAVVLNQYLAGVIVILMLASG